MFFCSLFFSSSFSAGSAPKRQTGAAPAENEEEKKKRTEKQFISFSTLNSILSIDSDVSYCVSDVSYYLMTRQKVRGSHSVESCL